VNATKNLEIRSPKVGVNRTRGRRRTAEIRDYILESTREHSSDLVAVTAKHFKLTHEGARRHVAQLVRIGELEAQGNAKARRYSLPSTNAYTQVYLLEPGLEEHEVWRELAKTLGPLRPSVRSILEYGFQEMVNNAIDHSKGSSLYVSADLTAVDITLWVMDDGVGVFERIRESLKLPSAVDAVVELVKGKVTTDPLRHSGEGIFFTSRAVDDFGLSANELFWSARYEDRDWVLESREPTQGTNVMLRMRRNATRQLAEVFNQYAGSNYSFSKTQIPVIVGRVLDEGLVSRSAARRLLSRLEAFEEVLLDFSGVKSIGQAFADEIFRVYVRAHPERRVLAVNAKGEVARMIRRTQAAS
jgi:anti-sigma regulatory factor (Ser/Thr protein kinase)